MLITYPVQAQADVTSRGDGLIGMTDVTAGPPRVRKLSDVVYPIVRVTFLLATPTEFTLFMTNYRTGHYELWQIPMVGAAGFDTYDCLPIPGTLKVDRVSGRTYTASIEVEQRGVAT